MRAERSLQAQPGAAIAVGMRSALIRYFRRGGGAVDAEDLAHDVLVRCLAHSLQGDPAKVHGYVFRAARNRWHDRRRRYEIRGSTVGWDDEAVELPHVEVGPEQLLALEEETNTVSRRFEELDRRARTILLWVKLEGMQIDRVARKLGVSRSTVNKSLARGLAHLRSYG